MDQHQTLETIKSSFLFNFRTGNVMLDTMVTGIIIMLSTYLLNIFNNLFSKFDVNYLTKMWLTGKSTSKITISGKKLQGTNSTRLQYSTNFFAVLYQIKKLNCVTSEISELSEVPVEEPDGVSYDYDDYSENSDFDNDYDDRDREKTSRGTATNLIVSQTAPFKMTEDVSGYVNITKENEGNEKNPVKAEEFQISLYSETLNADQLRLVLESWVKEYEGKLNKNNDKHLKFFLYSPSGDVTEDYYDPTRHYSELISCRDWTSSPRTSPGTRREESPTPWASSSTATRAVGRPPPSKLSPITPRDTSCLFPSIRSRRLKSCSTCSTIPTSTTKISLWTRGSTSWRTSTRPT